MWYVCPLEDFVVCKENTLMCMKDQEIPWSEKKIKLQSVMGTMAWMVQRILFSDVEV